MHYEVEIGGRRRQVVVTPTGDRFAVTLDGHTRQVDVARIDADTLSLIVDNVWPVDIIIAADRPAGLTVHVNGTPVQATLDGRRRAGRRAESAGSATRPQRGAAPRAGQIVRVLVKAGAAGHVSQPVVAVE